MANGDWVPGPAGAIALAVEAGALRSANLAFLKNITCELTALLTTTVDIRGSAARITIWTLCSRAVYGAIQVLRVVFGTSGAVRQAQARLSTRGSASRSLAARVPGHRRYEGVMLMLHAPPMTRGRLLLQQAVHGALVRHPVTVDDAGAAGAVPGPRHSVPG